MRLRDMLQTSALSGSLALYPLVLPAQDYDTWTLGREVLNSAANYTSVLTTAHREVRKYITWDWRTSLDEEAQQTRTDALLDEINDHQQVNAALVPSLKIDVLDSYAVRFRYCDNMLLSYFDGTSFKHGLSAHQIIAAPVLRAQRTGITFNGEPLGIIAGELVLGMRPPEIPACMVAEDNGGALAEGTVAYMTPAVRKLAARGNPIQGSRPGDCPATHPRGAITESREVKWRFPDSPYLQDFPELRDAVIKGTWETSEDGCYRNVNERTQETKAISCPGMSGYIYYQRVKTVTGVEWHTGASQLSPTYTRWVETKRICYRPPPPPPPQVNCWLIGAEKAQNRCLRNQRENRNSGGSNGRSGGDGGQESVDVDGDGKGDYKSYDSRAVGGTEVQGSCGGCNELSGGPSGGKNGGSDGGGDKIVCTAMNARYGFGSYRQAIWLAYARRMSPYHQTGYHLIFLPLVRYGYRAEGKTHLAIRHGLEHIARHRTADLRAEMQHHKRRILGRGYRAVLEPLCYAVGWMAGGRKVAGIADVAQIAARPKSESTAPKHIKNNKETVQ